MSVETILAFALASLLIIVIPGPSMLFSVARTLELGRLGGQMSVIGNTLGTYLLTFPVALGIGAIVARSVAAFTVVKVLGALYLVYLGIQGIRQRNQGIFEPTHVTRKAKTNWRVLRDGIVVGVTNPKSVVFFVAVLPQFVNLDAGFVPLQMLGLGLIFSVIALCSDSVWVHLAGTARKWFSSSPRNMRVIKASGGGIMVGLGGALLLASNN